MYALTAAVLGCILAIRTRAMLRTAGPARSLWAALVALEAAVVLKVDGVRRQVDTTTRSPGLSAILGHGLVVVAAGSVRSLLNGVTADAPLAGQRPRVAAGATAALVALLSPYAVLDAAQAGLVLTGRSERRDGRAVAIVLVSWSGYLAYMSWALAGSTRLCWTYGRRAAAGPTRTGLILSGTGNATGFAYVALKAVQLRRWARREPHDLMGEEGPAQRTVIFVVLVLISVGSGYEALSGRATAWRSAWRARRSLRRLFPLWQLVHELFPSQVMFPYGRSAPRLASAQTVRYLDVRRRTEVHDGLRLIDACLTAQVRTAALAEAQRQAGRADAPSLAVAACLHLARRQLPLAPQDGSQPKSTDAQQADPTDLSSVELERVAHYLRTPLPALIAGHLATAGSGPGRSRS